MNRIEYLQEVKKRLPENPVCVEIGVYRGDFSQMILDELNPRSLLLVDTWAEGEFTYDSGQKTQYSTHEDLMFVFNRFAQYMPYRKVMTCEVSSEVARKQCKWCVFDFVYIDATHRYESVKQDLEMWETTTSKDCLLCGHDYNSVVFTGVKKAVDEFIETGWEMILLSDEGDFALKRKE